MATNFVCNIAEPQTAVIDFDRNTDKSRHFIQGRDVLRTDVYRIDWKEKDAS
jgi:hypothetical protein